MFCETVLAFKQVFLVYFLMFQNCKSRSSLALAKKVRDELFGRHPNVDSQTS
jgi:hypothetical protein